MPNELTTENVDIFQCPALDTAHPADTGAQIISGDGHANAIKPLFLTVKYGIATNISKLGYENFVAIYKRSFGVPGLSALDLKEFQQFLDSTDFKSEATIHWLGDMLADRGGNDFLTLLILRRLRQCNVKFEIIFSNHDFEFIRNYENPDSDFSKAFILAMGAQCNSMTQLSQLLQKGLITRKEIDSIVKEAYLPALKLLSYTINEKGTEITLLSHAPIGIPNIAALARQFEVPYDETSLSGLANTIDEINRRFTEDYVKKGKISSLVSRAGLDNPEINPVGYAIWNRDTHGLHRPDKINNYSIRYVHGHDSNEAQKLPSHITNLDNELGKTALLYNNIINHYNHGSHTILYSHDKVSLQEIKPQQPISPSQQSRKNLEDWLIDVFAPQIIALRKSRVSVNQSAEHEFLKQLFIFGAELLKPLDLVNYNFEAAKNLAKLTSSLLDGAQIFFKDGNKEKFQAVCRHSFSEIQQQLQPADFEERKEMLVFLAKKIEDLNIGMQAVQLIPPRHHPIPPPVPAKEAHKLRQSLTEDFPEQLSVWRKSVDSKAKTQLFSQLQILATEALQLLDLKNYDGAKTMADLGKTLLEGAQTFSNNGNEIQFRAVCEDSFKTLQTQLQLSAFTQRADLFVALAKTIEKLRIGLRSEQLFPSPAVLRVSDKRASQFSATPSTISKNPDSGQASVMSKPTKK